MRLIPAWVWGLAACALLIGVQHMRYSSLSADYAAYRADIAERDRKASLQAVQRMNQMQREVAAADEQAQAKLEEARTDAVRAGNALERLRLHAAQLEQRARSCGNTITAQLGTSAENAARMHADLLGRIGEAAGRYAEIADSRGIAGAACESAYDGVRKSLGTQ